MWKKKIKEATHVATASASFRMGRRQRDCAAWEIGRRGRLVDGSVGRPAAHVSLSLPPPPQATLTPPEKKTQFQTHGTQALLSKTRSIPVEPIRTQHNPVDSIVNQLKPIYVSVTHFNLAKSTIT